MLPLPQRLKRRRDFAAVYARKKSWASSLLVLYIRRRDQSTSDGNVLETHRFGFSVSKKVGKAHDRNRVKRRLRHVCRCYSARIVPGFDGIWVVRTGAASAGFTQLENEALMLLKRARLLTQETQPNRGVCVNMDEAAKTVQAE